MLLSRPQQISQFQFSECCFERFSLSPRALGFRQDWETRWNEWHWEETILNKVKCDNTSYTGINDSTKGVNYGWKWQRRINEFSAGTLLTLGNSITHRCQLSKVTLASNHCNQYSVGQSTPDTTSQAKYCLHFQKLGSYSEMHGFPLGVRRSGTAPDPRHYTDVANISALNFLCVISSASKILRNKIGPVC